MNQQEIIIQKLNSLIVLGLVIWVSTWFSIGVMVAIAKRTQAEVNTRLTKITQQLEMFENAIPTGKEVIYLDDDLQKWLDDDSVTGYDK